MNAALSTVKAKTIPHPIPCVLPPSPSLQELYRKYCTSGENSVRSSDQVEAELTKHLHMSELRTALVTHRLEVSQHWQPSSDCVRQKAEKGTGGQPAICSKGM
jgi:hypothetical protein